ncbi:hypothetical protein AVEN_102313-1 [Araneus ventricosus]|uniref:Uncharacterized protein n=1 Tax=Araneus ventricosus TaxID=182803 RepID=A0A4Y2VKF9_ARAVE|nr:hypothetical protein AVEN_133403-1 [Araneus ventricosus]GBO25803.1 hypothetical protein AVEN_102313-1 [Araneus ventricosus]
MEELDSHAIERSQQTQVVLSQPPPLPPFPFFYLHRSAPHSSTAPSMSMDQMVGSEVVTLKIVYLQNSNLNMKDAFSDVSLKKFLQHALKILCTNSKKRIVPESKNNELLYIV